MTNCSNVRQEPLTTLELLHHWESLSNLSAGQIISRIPLYRLPSWADICSRLDWRTYRLDDGFFQKKHHGFYGVYRLIGLMTDGDLNSAATFNRICGADSTGTLYIGEGGIVHERLNALRRRKNRHKVIYSLRRIHSLDFPDSRLAVSVLFTGRNTQDVERMLIDAYVNSFGDTPPLNYRITVW
jgi:hypothetical protein